MVGAIGAVVDFGTFTLLWRVVGVWDVIAQAISFTAAVTSNFIWNRYWTYPDSRSKPLGRQALQFFVVNVIGLAIRTVVFDRLKPVTISFAEELLPSQFDSETVGVYSALVLAVIVVLFWNFGVNRVWTYSDVQ
ncbi:MAG: GtrA family protein [Anaerolineales bacterium]